MIKEHEIRLETVKIESKSITIYNVTHENKEVRVYSMDNRIFIKWYINGKLIERAIFPKEIITEMELFFFTIICKYIDKHLMHKIVNTMKRYLPYLEDGDDEDSVRNIILNVEVSR